MTIRSKAVLLLGTLELRTGSVITSEEIRALKHRWSWRGLMRRTKNPINIEAETFEMFDSFGPFQIDKALAESGLAWWKANLLRKDGTMRNNAWTQGQCLHGDGDMATVTAEGARILRILNGFDHFELTNWQVDYNHFNAPCASFPMFTMHGAGDSFTYIARPWQSGGRTEIV
jgi:hypothetical protein